MKTKTGKGFLILLLFLGGMSLNTVMAQSSNWTAPKSADLIKPTVDLKSPNVISEGKKLYTQLCAICHGDKGKGDGVAGMALNPRPKNFTTSKFQAQSDGAIYWKMTEGNPPMAPYKETLTEKQRWELVAYLRTLAKK
ncbi:MAG: cytochrome c [Bacteroidetes bacterium]|nr:MAG: cytochrome c [Bacteroidota bacterium]